MNNYKKKKNLKLELSISTAETVTLVHCNFLPPKAVNINIQGSSGSTAVCCRVLKVCSVIFGFLEH